MCHILLKRWVDRLLPFNFTVKYLAGKVMGFTDVISRSPIGKFIAPSNYDEDFVVTTISKIDSIISSTDTQFLD